MRNSPYADAATALNAVASQPDTAAYASPAARSAPASSWPLQLRRGGVDRRLLPRARLPSRASPLRRRGASASALRFAASASRLACLLRQLLLALACSTCARFGVGLRLPGDRSRPASRAAFACAALARASRFGARARLRAARAPHRLLRTRRRPARRPARRACSIGLALARR